MNSRPRGRSSGKKGNLREALRDYGFRVRDKAWYPEHMIRVESTLLTGFEQLPSASDRLDLYQKVLEAWTQRASKSLKLRLWRRVPWVLFHRAEAGTGVTQGTCLADDPEFLNAFLDWLPGDVSGRAVLRLLREFLREYPYGKRSFDSIRRCLRDVLVESEAQRLSEWYAKCVQFHFLDEDGGRLFVMDALSSRDPLEDYLAGATFSQPQLTRSGFLRQGIHRTLQHTGRSRISGTRLTRLIELLHLGGELRFTDPDSREIIATGLLTPFKNTAPPSNDLRVLKKFLRKWYRHPRTPDGKIRWRGVGQDIQGIYLRWLVGDTLSAFFSLIGGKADDKHWKYREAFWMAFYNAGHITDACFVLGDLAKRDVSKYPEMRKAPLADLYGGQAGHSVLLFRVGNLIVGEWSHSGSCRIWRGSNENAPKLHLYGRRRYYTRKKLLQREIPTGGADHVIRHDGSPTGSWQRKIAYILSARAGAYVSSDAYFPKDLR